MHRSSVFFHFYIENSMVAFPFVKSSEYYRLIDSIVLSTKNYQLSILLHQIPQPAVFTVTLFMLLAASIPE